jgi:2-(1,2-epoxy-1,2-dihydrophenyl)acetyl-CoA isomerase
MPSINFEVIGQVGFITLSRPEKYNAFNREMALHLQILLDDCANDNTIRCVYITGAGKAFCAGQDLEEVIDPKGPGMNRILSEQFNPIILKIHRLKKPVMAAINGVAAGAGANIALACDVVVATQSASFIQAFSKIGLIPDSGGTFTLPRLIGYQKASAIMMLGDKIMAEEAERMGMIYKWFADDTFESESKQIAITLSNLPTTGLALTKQALQWSDSHSLREQLENEDKLQQRAAATSDFKEGVQAFIEKRKAVFRGE